MPHAPLTSTVQAAEGIVKEVYAKGVAAVNEAVVWAERKAEKLSQEEGAGPYASPATCVPSDLDVIASGILPAVPSQEIVEKEMEREMQEQGRAGARKDGLGHVGEKKEQNK